MGEGEGGRGYRNASQPLTIHLGEGGRCDRVVTNPRQIEGGTARVERSEDTVSIDKRQAYDDYLNLACSKGSRKKQAVKKGVFTTASPWKRAAPTCDGLNARGKPGREKRSAELCVMVGLRDESSDRNIKNSGPQNRRFFDFRSLRKSHAKFKSSGGIYFLGPRYLGGGKGQNSKARSYPFLNSHEKTPILCSGGLAAMDE